MASRDGSERIGSSGGADRDAAGASRQGRTAAGQHAADVTSTDPDVLAAQIERTREELAETFDAIVDRVSPKRVARRTSKRVGETVKEKAAEASVAVKTGAAQVKESAAVAVGSVREKVSSSAPSVGRGAHGGSVALDSGGTAGAGPDPVMAGVALPPTEPVAVPSLATGAPLTAGTAVSQSTAPARIAPAHVDGVTTYAVPSLLRKEYAAGGAAALLVALLLLLRRRRS